MTEVRLHVQDVAGFFDDASAMARDLDAGRRVAAPADIAFESMDTLLKVLTPNRWRLLRAAHAVGPVSIRALAGAQGRDYRGVHADVSTLLEVGLMSRDKDGRIQVPWSKITAEMNLDAAA